ncbi:hypothetical protein DFH09DRAFT_1072951 [Mycena vulgaris]|nr:hypothetical protein DFH09DRAFT_1072951 [Mycena vulgaris]
MHHEHGHDMDLDAPALPMDDARDSGDQPGMLYSPAHSLKSPASSYRRSPSPHAPHQPPSLLLALPAELLTLIALHLATRPPNLGPPSALLPLLATCRLLHARLAYRFDAGQGNVGLWARIGRAKFSDCSSPSPFLDYSDDAGSKKGKGRGTAHRAAHALRARCLVLRTLRAGDVHAAGADRALLGAYAMLVADAGPAPPLATTELPPLPDALLPPSRVEEEHDARREGGRGGKNRKQLAWAGAREFALRWVSERLWEGRFGEGDEHEVEQEQGAEEGESDPWTVGWPRDREESAAALWVIWFFEGWETLRVESEDARRALMALLLPFVVAPFRYPSTLCPPHHYSVPLLPSVRASMGRGEATTVPTGHGAYPIYPLGDAPSPIPISALREGAGARSRARTRLLTAPPARLLFFARMQAGGRMGVPPHLAADRAAAEVRWVAAGGIGPQPIGPTAEDIYEKNARPVVRFERQLVGWVPPPPPPAPATTSPSDTASSTPISTAGPADAAAVDAAPAQANADADAAQEEQAPEAPLSNGTPHPAALAVPPFCGAADEDEDEDDDSDAEGRERWAAHAWRARLCVGYGGASSSTPSSAAPPSVPSSSSGAGGSGAGGRAQARDTTDRDRAGTGSGKGGAAPGRIGRVYEPGSFSGLWAGTMLMSSEPPYNALIAAPGGAFPPDGLVRDDFVAAARPVYMRIAEHHSFYPNTPVPPPLPDSTTGEEGMRAGWLPPGTRLVPGDGGTVELRVAAPGALARLNAWERAFGYADGGGVGARGEEGVYVYETVGEVGGKARAREGAHDREGCVGCVRVRERERWRRAGEEEDSLEAPPQERASASSGGSSTPSSSSSVSAPASSASAASASQEQDQWPEWDAPAWAGHRFADDEGWEGACDGVQDVVFTGSTDPRHGMAWHHYEYAGRVRPWDGLIGLVMRPRDRTIGLATYFISGHIVGRDTFEGTWQMAAQDVLAPSWGGSVCLARGEE